MENSTSVEWGVAGGSRVWDFEERRLESPVNIRQINRATPSFRGRADEGVNEGVNQLGFCSKKVLILSYNVQNINKPY